MDARALCISILNLRTQTKRTAARSMPALNQIFLIMCHRNSHFWLVLLLVLVVGTAGSDVAEDGACDAEAKDSSGCGCGALSRDSTESGPSNGKVDSTHGSSGAGESDEDAAMVDLPGGASGGLTSTHAHAGGLVVVGSDAGYFPEDGEGPAREIVVSPFRIGKYEVSNARFSEFIKATGYKTEAEGFGNSFVVEQFISKAISEKIQSAVAAAPWWLPVDKADWQHPEGPDTNISKRMDHPVIHVSWNDAQAFCRWSQKGGRLPTEVDFDSIVHGLTEARLNGNSLLKEDSRISSFRGGKLLSADRNADVIYSNKLMPKGKHYMNIWQSTIHEQFLKDKNVFKHRYRPVDRSVQILICDTAICQPRMGMPFTVRRTVLRMGTDLSVLAQAYIL